MPSEPLDHCAPILRRVTAWPLLPPFAASQAIQAEVAAHIAAHSDLTDGEGRRRIVRHGYLPAREVQTGIGAVAVTMPRVRDRDPSAPGGRIRFTSSILPPYLRRSKSVEELLPLLYLKGVSTGDFSEALAALLGPDAPGLTASTIGRLKAVWQDEYEAWQKRDLSARRYVYFWADGIYFSPRMDHDKQCLLVIVGADDKGNKDIVGLMDGYRESAQSWKELLLDLKSRLSLSYIFISHDLAVVEHVSDRVAVMYLGRIVETTDTESLYRQPAHPYTEALISAVPQPDPERDRTRIVLSGDIPNPESPPSGCPFHPRCPKVLATCPDALPALKDIGDKAHPHLVACHLH